MNQIKSKARKAVVLPTASTEAAAQALQRHRVDLEHKRDQTAAELDAWRQDHSGFTSMSRVAQAAGELVTTDHSLSNFIQRAGEPEAYGASPLRLHMQALEERIDLTTAAEAHLADGTPLLGATARGRDLILDEIALSLDVPLAREDLVAHRAARLTQAIEEGKPDEALEAYLAVSALYLEAEGESGESVHHTKGRPSLTSQVNGWILSGRLRTRGPLALTADDLEKWQKKILKTARALDEADALPPGTPPITGPNLRCEIERLRALEQRPEHTQLLEAGVRQSHTLFTKRGRGKKLDRFGRGMLRLLDSPETYAMVLMGALAGTFGRLVMREAAVGAADIDALRRGSKFVRQGLRISKVKGPLTATSVGRFAATRAAEGVGFHAGMNLFQYARRKPERVSWGLSDFARSVALFEVLGGVHVLQHAQKIENAVLRSGAVLGEETLGLSLLGLGECWLHGGDATDALELLEGNLQFLLAMRLLSGARWARQTIKGESSASLADNEREAMRDLRRAGDTSLALEQRTELATSGMEKYLAYYRRLAQETERLHRSGSAGSPEPVRRAFDIDKLDPEVRAKLEQDGVIAGAKPTDTAPPPSADHLESVDLSTHEGRLDFVDALFKELLPKEPVETQARLNEEGRAGIIGQEQKLTDLVGEPGRQSLSRMVAHMAEHDLNDVTVRDLVKKPLRELLYFFIDSPFKEDHRWKISSDSVDEAVTRYFPDYLKGPTRQGPDLDVSQVKNNVATLSGTQTDKSVAQSDRVPAPTLPELTDEVELVNQRARELTESWQKPVTISKGLFPLSPEGVLGEDFDFTDLLEPEGARVLGLAVQHCQRMGKVVEIDFVLDNLLNLSLEQLNQNNVLRSRIPAAEVARRVTDIVTDLSLPDPPTVDEGAAKSAVSTTEPPPAPAVTPETLRRIESLDDGTWADVVRSIADANAEAFAPIREHRIFSDADHTAPDADAVLIARLLSLFSSSELPPDLAIEFEKMLSLQPAPGVDASSVGWLLIEHDLLWTDPTSGIEPQPIDRVRSPESQRGDALTPAAVTGRELIRSVPPEGQGFNFVWAQDRASGAERVRIGDAQVKHQELKAQLHQEFKAAASASDAEPELRYIFGEIGCKQAPDTEVGRIEVMSTMAGSRAKEPTRNSPRAADGSWDGPWPPTMRPRQEMRELRTVWETISSADEKLIKPWDALEKKLFDYSQDDPHVRPSLAVDGFNRHGAANVLTAITQLIELAIDLMEGKFGGAEAPTAGEFRWRITELAERARTELKQRNRELAERSKATDATPLPDPVSDDALQSLAQANIVLDRLSNCAPISPKDYQVLVQLAQLPKFSQDPALTEVLDHYREACAQEVGSSQRLYDGLSSNSGQRIKWWLAEQAGGALPLYRSLQRALEADPRLRRVIGAPKSRIDEGVEILKRLAKGEMPTREDLRHLFDLARPHDFKITLAGENVSGSEMRRRYDLLKKFAAKPNGDTSGAKINTEQVRQIAAELKYAFETIAAALAEDPALEPELPGGQRQFEQAAKVASSIADGEPVTTALVEALEPAFFGRLSKPPPGRSASIF